VQDIQYEFHSNFERDEEDLAEEEEAEDDEEVDDDADEENDEAEDEDEPLGQDRTEVWGKSRGTKRRKRAKVEFN